MKRPSPGLIVALVALFAATAGTATALKGHNTVKSDDIAAGNVRTGDLANAAVTPRKADLVKAATTVAALGTSSTTPVDLSGPSVAVRVGSNALVQVFAQADVNQTGGGGGDEGKVHLFEPTVLPTAPKILGTTSNTFETRYATPGTGNASGATSVTRGGAIALNLPPGTYTFSLRYSVDAGTATFQNRRIWVSVLQ